MYLRDSERCPNLLIGPLKCLCVESWYPEYGTSSILVLQLVSQLDDKGSLSAATKPVHC